MGKYFELKVFSPCSPNPSHETGDVACSVCQAQPRGLDYKVGSRVSPLVRRHRGRRDPRRSVRTYCCVRKEPFRGPQYCPNIMFLENIFSLELTRTRIAAPPQKTLRHACAEPRSTCCVPRADPSRLEENKAQYKKADAPKQKNHAPCSGVKYPVNLGSPGHPPPRARGLSFVTIDRSISQTYPVRELPGAKNRQVLHSTPAGNGTSALPGLAPAGDGARHLLHVLSETRRKLRGVRKCGGIERVKKHAESGGRVGLQTASPATLQRKRTLAYGFMRNWSCRRSNFLCVWQGTDDTGGLGL